MNHVTTSRQKAVPTDAEHTSFSRAAPKNVACNGHLTGKTLTCEAPPAVDTRALANVEGVTRLPVNWSRAIPAGFANQ